MGKTKRARKSNGSANMSCEDNEEHGLDQVINKVVQGGTAASSPTVTTEQLLHSFMGMMTKINTTLERISDRLERSEGELHEILIERDKLKAENIKLKKELSDKSEMLEVETEHRERLKRSQNIKITGISVANKQREDVTGEIIALHNDTLPEHPKLTTKDVLNTFVIRGRGNGDKKTADSVIITLSNIELKKHFYALAAAMRKANRPIFVGDDLTAGQRQLLYELKKTNLFTKVAFRDGAVRCQKKDGGWRQFTYLHEVQKLQPSSTTGTSD